MPTSVQIVFYDGHLEYTVHNGKFAGPGECDCVRLAIHTQLHYPYTNRIHLVKNLVLYDIALQKPFQSQCVLQVVS